MNCDKKCHEIHKYVGIQLIETARYDKKEKVQELLYINVNPNFHDKYGITTLIWASWRGHLDVVNQLLDCKEINVNLQINYGNTALMRASMRGHLDVVKKLNVFQKAQIIKGFKLVNLSFPNDLINLIVKGYC